MKIQRIPLLVLLLSFFFIAQTFSSGEVQLEPHYPSARNQSFRFPAQFYVTVPSGATSLSFESSNAKIIRFKLYEFESRFKNGILLADVVSDRLEIKQEWVGKDVYAIVSVTGKGDKETVSNPMLKPEFQLGDTAYVFKTKKVITAWVAVGKNSTTEFVFKSYSPIVSFELEYTLQADKAAYYSEWARKAYFPRPSQGLYSVQTSPFVVKSFYPRTSAPIYVRANMLVHQGYRSGGDIYKKFGGQKEYSHQTIQFFLNSTADSMMPEITTEIFAVTAGPAQPLWFYLAPYVGEGAKPQRVVFNAVSQKHLPFTVEENGELVGYEDAFQMTSKLGKQKQGVLEEFQNFGAKWRISLTYNAFSFTRDREAEAFNSIKTLEFRDADGNVILNPIEEKLAPFGGE